VFFVKKYRGGLCNGYECTLKSSILQCDLCTEVVNKQGQRFDCFHFLFPIAQICVKGDWFIIKSSNWLKVFFLQTTQNYTIATKQKT